MEEFYLTSLVEQNQILWIFVNEIYHSLGMSNEASFFSSKSQIFCGVCDLNLGLKN